MSGDTREVMDVPQAAAYLGVGERTLRRWLKDGAGIPHAKIGGGLIRFRRSALLEWLETQERTTATGTESEATDEQ